MIRIVTWNIRNGQAEDGPDHWDHRKERVADLIRDLDPDVLALQEPYDFQMEAVQRALPGHLALGVGRENGLQAGEFCGLFVRKASVEVGPHGTFWFSDTPDLPGSKSWGNEIPRCCTWAEVAIAGKPFQVLNVHLDHASQASRLKSVDLLLKRLPASSVVLGDFNAFPESPEIMMMEDAPLVNVFRDSAERDKGTFHGFTGQGQGGPIDYIFADSKLKVCNAWVDRRSLDGRFPSDHFALVADFDLQG